jgi:tetratricopeptide (TPR) repeat protein
VRARRLLAIACSRQKDYNTAIELYQAVLEREPDDFRCRNALGAIYTIFYRRRPEQDHLRLQALEHWHRSLEVNPDQPTIRACIRQYAAPLAAAGGTEAAPAPADEAPAPEPEPAPPETPAEGAPAETAEAPTPPPPPEAGGTEAATDSGDEAGAETGTETGAGDTGGPAAPPDVPDGLRIPIP